MSQSIPSFFGNRGCVGLGFENQRAARFPGDQRDAQLLLPGELPSSRLGGLFWALDRESLDPQLQPDARLKESSSVVKMGTP